MKRDSQPVTGSPRIDSLPLGREVRVLAADRNGLLALEKPIHRLSHPNSARDYGKSLVRAFYDPEEQCYTWTDEDAGTDTVRRLWLLNRLDSATSGVILCATERAVATAVRQKFAAGEVGKSYLALVFGAPPAGRRKWTDSLAVERRGGRVRARPGGHRRATATAILKERFPGPPELSLIELLPGTGRTHQLRVQCAHRGFPVVGDQTYGDFRANREFARRTGRKRLFLHCARTRVRYSLGGETFSFEACSPVPGVFHNPFGD